MDTAGVQGKTIQFEEAFPENPFLPSIAFAAIQQLPISIPWTNQPIDLGAGFNTRNAASSTPFCTTKAFSENSLANASPVFYEDSTGSYVESTSNSGSDSYDHLDFSVAASVGGSVLGASGRGKYETKALSNKDVRNALRVRWQG